LKRPIWLSRLIVQALLIALGTVALSPARPLSLSSAPPLDDAFVGRVYVRDRDHLNAVAGELDIWETHREEGYVLAAITSEQARWLENLGYRVEPDETRVAALGATAALDPRFYYFDHQLPNPNGRYVVDLLQEINGRYPQLTELVDIGDAWMAGQPGEPDRDLWVLRVTNEDPAYGPMADKPAFFLAAAMHPREVATAELAVRYLRYLTDGCGGEGGYGVDADVTWLVDHHVAYVLVVHNPDGHVENERSVANNRRKTMDWDDGCSYSAFWGVDLNRNHSFLWNCCGGSSGDPCRETYRGPSPASEPETQACEAYVRTVMKDQNGPNGADEIAAASPITTTGILISLHSYGDLVLWPWGFQGYGSAPNQAELRTIGHKFASYNGYNADGTIWYDVDGAVDDWAYGALGIPSFTFEVGPEDGACGGFFPAYECIDGYAARDFWAENKPAFLYAHRIARAPYLRAYGPDVQSVTFSALERLAADIADRRYPGDSPQAVVAAEYFIAEESAEFAGEDGTGVPMSPADGAWGGLAESAVAQVDASERGQGRRIILVHGQSEDGTWGPFTATFAWVGQRIYLPLVVRP